MIRELRRVATKDMIFLVERFAMYDDVFKEYLNTLKLIDEGKALMFENFQSLSRNYRKNVQVFASEALLIMKKLNERIDSYSLQKIATGISNYINGLNEILTCIDLQTEVLDQAKQNEIMMKIENAKNELCNSIKEASI
ncbi:hypothetical protein RD055328_05650 [Companilactobacillus sp. RD055328]|uniref:hypothetical protein n=1 Tax=Companilactobacillus sp. RD055328 TaxID=2916634 RepID=UPI001FC8CF11|nr:hypothetical protein [Companilactobacillus sp. RD055328]GKQ42642.1 hypothetical protein RD055328_05650 [Companilactobacillus sp. RD055328]